MPSADAVTGPTTEHTQPAGTTELPRRPSWLVVSVALVTVLVVGTAVGWAARVVFTPEQPALATATQTVVAATEGRVGSSLQLNTVAAWATAPAGANAAVGVVTSVVVTPAQQVAPGDVLYTVDLRPVVVAAGAVPSFRALGADARGADVEQLQRLLAAKGYLSESRTISGRADPATVAAVRQWQQDLGVPVDGVVQPADVIYVPELPARVLLDTTVLDRGTRLVGGEAAVRVLAAQPSFTVPLTDTQAGLMPPGTPVQVQPPDGAAWDAEVASVGTPDGADAVLTAVLTGPGGASVCGDRCGVVPATGKSQLPSRVITQPEVSGVVVPTSALRTKPDGTVVVIDEPGVEHPVTVLGTGQGRSVVKGIDSGLGVLAPAPG